MIRIEPTVVVNPKGDAVFDELIEVMLRDGVQEPDSLQERLRARFPRVVVRCRGLADERIEVWYVYREGYWVSGL